MNELFIDKSMEQEFADRMAYQMQQEIDWGILADMFINMGWVKTTFDPYMESAKSNAMTNWLKDNCTGSYKTLGSQFIFEKEQDLIMFTLRWL
jgi:hypothetical protein